MNAGVIAAGHGSRLSGSHPGLIKPLIPVAGAPLSHWIVGGLKRAGAREVTLLHNSRGRALRESLRAAFPELALSFLEADTASSWESFRLLARALAARSEAFLISTVDALIAPEEVARFARAMEERDAQAGLALTDFVDDEKPLWAELGEGGLISALGETCRSRRLATAGLYYLRSEAACRLPEPAAFDSLRGYWGSLVASGARVAGLALAKAIDVDRPEDIRQAEGFLKATAPW